MQIWWTKRWLPFALTAALTSWFGLAQVPNIEAVKALAGYQNLGPANNQTFGFQIVDNVDRASELDGEGEVPHRGIDLILRKTINDSQKPLVHGDLAGISANVLAGNRSLTGPELDAQGSPVLDENGQPVIKDYQNGFLGLFGGVGIDNSPDLVKEVGQYNHLDHMVGVLGSATLRNPFGDPFVNPVPPDTPAQRYATVRDREGLAMVGGLFTAEMDSLRGYASEDPIPHASGVVGYARFTTELAQGRDGDLHLGGNVLDAHGGLFRVGIDSVNFDGKLGRADIKNAYGTKSTVSVGKGLPGGSARIENAFAIYAAIDDVDNRIEKKFAVFAEGGDVVFSQPKWKDWYFPSKAKLFGDWRVDGVKGFAEADSTTAQGLIAVEGLGSDQKLHGTVITGIRVKWLGGHDEIQVSLIKRDAAEYTATTQEVASQTFQGNGRVMIEKMNLGEQLEADHAYYILVRATVHDQGAIIYDIGIQSSHRAY